MSYYVVGICVAPLDQLRIVYKIDDPAGRIARGEIVAEPHSYFVSLEKSGACAVVSEITTTTTFLLGQQGAKKSPESLTQRAPTAPAYSAAPALSLPPSQLPTPHNHDSIAQRGRQQNGGRGGRKVVEPHKESSKQRWRPKRKQKQQEKQQTHQGTQNQPSKQTQQKKSK